ncbi:hypothetical protein TNCV_3994081 [Trichonephila clavipes]|uniref:Uncharacterized protein n=1 Tax=Trichonephila clavipes TaxID=2585209 RepID=A0A8X6VPB7_TRICX|nr:hypothetical protein TNCV_3994081 [Trichonephila clavipes]
MIEYWVANFESLRSIGLVDSAIILTFQKFVDQMSSMCLALSPIKIKSGPTATGNRPSRPHPYASQQPQCLFQRHSDSSLKTFRDVKIPASKLRLLACRRWSNSNDLLPNMQTLRSAMPEKRLLPDTGLRVLRTKMPE